MSSTLSKSEWESWCKDFGEANQTKIAFCRTHDLNYHQFLYWFKKLNKSPAKLIPGAVEICPIVIPDYDQRAIKSNSYTD